MIWSAANKFGIAIWNYIPRSEESVDVTSSHHLELLIGEPVHICRQSEDWYYGHSLVGGSVDKYGIFPKAFMSTQEYRTSLKSAKSSEVVYKYSFDQEVIFTLREWGKKMKKMYIENDVHGFNTAKELITEVIAAFQRCKSGKVTSDEEKSVKIEICDKLDMGNKLLGFDLAVRDLSFEITNPFEMSIIEYYALHQLNDQKALRSLRTLKRLSAQATEQHQSLQGMISVSSGTSSGNTNTKRNSLFRISSISNGQSSCASSTDLTSLSSSTNAMPTSGSTLTSSSGPTLPGTSNSTYSICVTLVNFICTVRQDMDIVMAIYDAGNARFISENFVVKWDKQGLVANIDKLNDIRVVFPDLSHSDICQKLYLVCTVIRIGSMHVETSKMVQYRKSMHPSALSGQLSGHNKKDGKGGHGTQEADELRRPCGIAVYDLADFFARPEEYHDERRELFFPFIPYNEKDGSFDALIRKSTKDLQKGVDNAQGSASGLQPPSVSPQLKTQGFHVHLRDLSHSKMHLLEQTSYVARRIGFPEVILPDDYRNDLYLSLVSGEFHKQSGKKSERNIEVTVKVIGGDVPIEGALSVGTETLRTTYKSVVYYHEDRPRWTETIKVALSVDDFRRSHLRFTFKHRSSSENKDKNEKPFAVAFLPLMKENGTTLTDSEHHDLLVYKVDGRRFSETDTAYLQLPCSKAELERRFGVDVSSEKEVKAFFAKTNLISGSSTTISTASAATTNYNCSPKDTFTVAIVVCSTKLAQDINIFGLLNWKEKKDDLENILKGTKNLKGEDVVKFLHDALDALFEIWTDEETPTSYDRLVFRALVTILGLLLQPRYIHFQQLLSDYIERHFSATLIFSKLVSCFKTTAELTLPLSSDNLKAVYSTVACMHYLFKFIVRSRTLFVEMNGEDDGGQFADSLAGLLEVLCNLMRTGNAAGSTGNTKQQITATEKELYRVKVAILKFLPRCLADIATVYDARRLSSLLVTLLKSIPPSEEPQMRLYKLLHLHDLTDTPLFSRSDCRGELLPVITSALKDILLRLEEESSWRDDKIGRCLAIAGDVLRFLCRQEQSIVNGSLSRSNLSSIRADISEMATALLGPMIVGFEVLKKEEETGRNSRNSSMSLDSRTATQHHLWSLVLTLLHQMSDYHYEEYFSFLRRTEELNAFLLKLLRLFQACCTERGSFPPDWSDMYLVQNSVILKSMHQIVHFIKARADLQTRKRTASSSTAFDYTLTRELFLTAIAYITQRPLQLEAFSGRKRKRIISTSGSPIVSSAISTTSSLEQTSRDMRLEMVILLRSLWYFLGGGDQKAKSAHIPSIIGPLLEVALLPVFPIRQNALTIFFDMLYVAQEGAGAVVRGEVLRQLDSLVVVGGRGDLPFRSLLETTILAGAENHPPAFKESCRRFVAEVGTQMEKLLVYREALEESKISGDDDATSAGHESLTSCLVDLLHFYRTIDRKELYIRYLYRLYEHHLRAANYVEAAYTLAEQCRLLEWSERPLEGWLLETGSGTGNSQKRWSKDGTSASGSCRTHRELMQTLFREIVRHFDVGQLWEAGLEYCRRLYEQYETVLFDYGQLSALLLQMSSFYDNIIKSVRVEPEYFHVTYYGGGFPVLLRGRSFIYRGKSYERLVDFSRRLREQFPKAQLLTRSVDEPEEAVTKSVDGQHLAVFRVDPVMKAEVKKRFSLSGFPVDEKVTRYYQYNDISDFTFSRPKLVKPTGSSGDASVNEFACMWIERSHFKTASSLPGLLCRAEVVERRKLELNPLQNAIETMEKANEKTRNISLRYLADGNCTSPLHFLLMHINGYVNADVQGGVSKYEEAFFSPEPPEVESGLLVYTKEDIDRLKELIAAQIPLLDLAIRVANERQQRASLSGVESMDGLYRRIVESFNKMREDVEAKYGRRELPADLKKIQESSPLLATSNTLNVPDGQQRRNSNARTSESSNRNSFEGSSVSGESGGVGSLMTLTKRNKNNKQNGSTSNLTLRFRKNRRVSTDTGSTTLLAASNSSQSQWYDTSLSNSNSDILDHPRLENFPENGLVTSGTSTRNSRPNSGHYSGHRASIQSHLSIYHYNPGSTSSGVGSLHSSASTLTLAHSTSLNEGREGSFGGSRAGGSFSGTFGDEEDEDEDVPPPLPAKQSAQSESLVKSPVKMELCKQEAIDDSINNNNNDDYTSYVGKKLPETTTTSG